MMELNIEKIYLLENIQKKIFNFLFLSKSRLNGNDATYDIAVHVEKANELKGKLQQGKEGAK